MNRIATVERSPEKAGVGGSIPSLATILLKLLRAALRGEGGSERRTARAWPEGEALGETPAELWIGARIPGEADSA